MLGVLRQVEDDLPSLLLDESEWNDIDVDYHPPRVERLFRIWKKEFRVYLHKIFPCKPEEALFHPHPWPSGMLLLDGSYEMGIGNGVEQPTVIDRQIMQAGSRYEMVDPNDWHYVAPIDEPVMSLMVTGPSWKRPSPKPHKFLERISAEARTEIFAFFRDKYLK